MIHNNNVTLDRLDANPDKYMFENDTQQQWETAIQKLLGVDYRPDVCKVHIVSKVT